MAGMNRRASSADLRPRISIIGKTSSILSWQVDLIEAFQALACNVRLHGIQSAGITERAEQLLTNRRQLENQATSRRIADELKQFAPDLVIILNKAGLSPYANGKWRNAVPGGTPIIGWICDRLLALPAEQHPNLDGLYYFDSSSKPAMEAAYRGTSAVMGYLPLAASPDRFHDHPIRIEDLVPALVFVGHCSPSRRGQIEAYRAIGGKVEVYGPHAEGLTERSRIRRFSATEQAALYRSHLACFNPPQEVNTLDGLNLRAFEVPLSGGLGTYPASAHDLSTCFEPGVEILAYDSLPDLKAKIESLACDPERNRAIREAGRQRVLREHTFIHRAMKIRADWLPNIPIA